MKGHVDLSRDFHIFRASLRTKFLNFSGRSPGLTRSTGTPSSGRVSRTLDKQRPGFRCWPVGEDGPDHGHVPNRHPGLVRPSHILHAHERNRQQNQDAQKAGTRLPGSGVLQTRDFGDSRGQVRFNRMSQFALLVCLPPLARSSITPSSWPRTPFSRSDWGADISCPVRGRAGSRDRLR